MNRPASRGGIARPVWWLGLLTHPLTLVGIVLGLLVARIAWHVFVSRLTLLEDEAHYWEWSRRLDWSYYTKGPGVAWVIRASTGVFGISEWAIRLPAAVSGAIGAIAAALAARWSLPDSPDRAALTTLSALLFVLVPGFAVASMIMTIDAPYVACWAIGGAFAARALIGGSRRAWIGLGLAVAVGFLFKYTILLIVPGLALAAVVTRERRPEIKATSVALASLVACIGLLPVLVWNAQNDWSTVRHLLGHLGVAGGDMPAKPLASHWTPVWFLEYLGLQLFVCGPVLLLALIGWFRSRRVPEPQIRTAFDTLGSIALPIFVFYALVALRTQTEGNWAMAGTATLTPLAAWTVVDGVRRSALLVRSLWGAALLVGGLCLIAFPALRPLSERPNVGPYVPYYRLSGMREHAESAADELARVREGTNQEPFVMADHYGRASQLAFYLPGRPVVYCASSMLGGRKTQHDLWTETDLRNPDTIDSLLGRPALLFGKNIERFRLLFDRVEPIDDLPGEPKPAARGTFVGYGFRGFETDDRRRRTGDQP